MPLNFKELVTRPSEGFHADLQLSTRRYLIKKLKIAEQCRKARAFFQAGNADAFWRHINAVAR